MADPDGSTSDRDLDWELTARAVAARGRVDPLIGEAAALDAVIQPLYESLLLTVRMLQGGRAIVGSGRLMPISWPIVRAAAEAAVSDLSHARGLDLFQKGENALVAASRTAALLASFAEERGNGQRADAAGLRAYQTEAWHRTRQPTVEARTEEPMPSEKIDTQTAARHWKEARRGRSRHKVELALTIAENAKGSELETQLRGLVARMTTIEQKLAASLDE